jgi:hypothetical protein
MDLFHFNIKFCYSLVIGYLDIQIILKADKYNYQLPTLL